MKKIIKAVPLIFLLAYANIGEAKEIKTIRFGGWSHHMTEMNDALKKDLGQYNETQNGIGFEVGDLNLDTGLVKTFGFNYLKDSYDKDAYTVGGTLRKRFFATNELWMDIGAFYGIQSRSYSKTHNHRLVDIKRITLPVAAPMLSVGVYGFSGNLLVYPHLERVNGEIQIKKPVLFFQLAYEF